MHTTSALLFLFGGMLCSCRDAGPDVGGSAAVKPGDTAAVKPGDTAPIPRTSSLYSRIDVIGVRSSDGAPLSPAPDYCVFVQGATVTVVEVSERNVAASYKAVGGHEEECPDGTLFVHPKNLFVLLEQDYERAKANDLDRQEIIRRVTRER